jgi:Asp-tRNA(Asn)/Glu-tRNA(Gln) amidotransferase A subunit family amidase
MDEGVTAVAEELVTPAIETQTPETAQVPDPKDEPIDLDAPREEETPTELAPEGEEQPTAEAIEPDVVEIELNGKKYSVPAELKDGYLMQADYTRKTQEVAELKKASEAKIAEADTYYQVSQEVLEARATLLNVEGQLNRYQNLDWAALESEDPVGAMSAWREFQQLKEVRGNIGGFLDKQQNEMSEKAKLETENRLRETRKFAEEKIPGWSTDVDAKITEFAESKGFTRETLLNAYSPPVYEVLYLAWLGNQSLQKQQAAPKAPTIAVQPLRTVSAKSSPAVTKSPADMSMDEYAKWSDQKFKR